MSLRTEDLPATPARDRVIATADWDDAPDDLPADAVYRRRIGRWLLWRSGPPLGGHATYYAFDPDDLARRHEFRLTPEGDGDGVGPSGIRHTRFRTWKEDLRDNP